MKRSFSEEQLRSIAERARSRSSGGVTRNVCDVVSNEFAHHFETEWDIWVPAARYAPFDGRKHYVAVLPTDICRFTEDDGWVVVDATVTQFEEHVDFPLPDVAVLPPGDPRRSQWYDSIRLPE